MISSDNLYEADVSDFPQLEYSKKDVVRAGKALVGQLGWEPDERAATERIFSIANSWRASHAFPMHRIRAQLHGRMSALQLKGLTAARLKQMSSIRSKLGRLDGNLRQLQDLGGCRAIVPTIGDVRKLVRDIVEKSPHVLKSQNPYMDEPRDSGYRSHHLVFAFEPRDATEKGYAGRLIEVQIRSRLQHSWATAVEAVGLYRDEKLKNGVGSADWLRLFKLMSLEVAASEGCEYAKEGSNSRVQEIIALNASLDAIRTLDTLSHAVSNLDRILPDRHHKPRYCLIEYDHQLKRVNVKYLDGPSKIGGALNEANDSRYSSVVVEMDKIDNLKEAYPNYFGDVQLFKSSLSLVVNGKAVEQYSLPPIEKVPPPPKEIPDDSWLRFPNRRNRRWEDG
jgi:hypothetical protein